MHNRSVLGEIDLIVFLRRRRATVAMASLWVLLVQIGLGFVPMPDRSATADAFGAGQICTVVGAERTIVSPASPADQNSHGDHDCGLCSVVCAAGGCTISGQSAPIVFAPSLSVAIPFVYGEGVRSDAAFFPRSHPRAPPALV